MNLFAVMLKRTYMLQLKLETISQSVWCFFEYKSSVNVSYWNLNKWQKAAL